jgi:DNA polymerase I-like protein with 3'-5' exonuclease and polymerase domains
MPTLVTLDFETYYSREFSLSKITTEHYVRSPEFETIGLGIKFAHHPTDWIKGPDVAKALAKIDWSDKLVLAQNTAFDAAILSWHYGVKPMAWLDTLGMSRALFPHEKSHSLSAQANRLGIGVKGDEVNNALGKRYADFTPEELARYGEYCKNDVELTYALFNRYMAMGFPKQELKLIDLTLRMFVEPVLELDASLLQTHLAEVRCRKQSLLEDVRDALCADLDADTAYALFTAGLDGVKKLIMSNEKFAAQLAKLGVEPPRKISTITGKETWAFAKTDEAFKALEEHPMPEVQALVAARLGNKTTLEETRTERFIEMASRGAFPVPLRYYGAHSGRWCLTGDHEVLTRTGWVRLDRWNGEPIRQWNPDTKQISWASSPTLSSFDVDEDVIEFSGKYHNATYTTEHRIPVRKRHTADDVTDVTAGHMAGLVKKEMYVSGYAVEDGREVPDDMLRLIVAMHADGYNVQDAKNNIVRFRFSRERKVARLKTLLDAMGIRYTVTNYPSEPHVTVVIVRGADAPDWLRSAKRLPDWFYDLGGRSASVVIAELSHWDGHACTDMSFEWSGKDSDAADKYMALAHLCGYRATLTIRSRQDKGWADSYRVNFAKTTTITTLGKHAARVRFAGKVYCPTVDTGYFLCRRRGAIVITGNSGQDSVNMQNLPSRGPNAGKIKKSIKAPPGHVVIDCDSAQIEARTLAWLAGQADLVEAFRNKQDVYKLMASKIYGVPVDKIDGTQRQVGKTVVLGAGYGVGHVKLQGFLKTQAKVEVSLDEAKRIIDTYRSTSPAIADLWARSGDALRALLLGQEMTVDAVGLIRAVPGKGLTLPSGLYIQYPELRAVANKEGKRELTYTSKGLPVRIYGGKCVENFTQAVARCIVAEQMLRIAKRYKVVLTVHDAVAIVAPEAEAKEAQAYVEECMSWNPKWATGLPLACESGIGASYGDC